MSKSSIGWRKAGISSLATAALVAGACVAGAGAANATTNFNFQRLSGTNRYGTSAAVAKQFGQATDVILASGLSGHYPDALAANYLAGTKDAPVLLTNKDNTPPSILQAIKDTGADTIWIVGGTGVISQAQEDALVSDGYNVHRISGVNRYETAAKVINAGGTSSGEGIVATGENFPDALGAGPLAYAKDMPLAISQKFSINQDEIDALKAQGVTKVLIVGGTSAVSNAVAAQLEANNITVEKRLSGTNRSATAEAVANYELAHGFTDKAVNVASGFAQGDGADALGGGALSGATTTPMLITMSDVSPGAATLDYLTTNAKTLASGFLFGGTAAINDDAAAQMTAAAQAVNSNQSYTVAPQGNQSQTVSTVATPTAGNVTYTVTGLPANSTVNVALFPSSGSNAPSTGADGQTTFTSSNANAAGAAAGEGTTDNNVAFIESVNGAPQGSNAAGNSTREVDGIGTGANGTISFVVNSFAPDDAIPVVWQDAKGGTDNALDVDANGNPTDPFGVGGDVQWTPAAAPSGSSSVYTDWTIDSVNTAANTFTADSGGTTYTFSYDSNDTFNVDGVPATMATFENNASSGDTVTMDYSSDPAASSSFQLTNTAPNAPTSVTAAAQSDTSIKVAWVDSTTPDVTAYNVYQAAWDATLNSGSGGCPAFDPAVYKQVGSVADSDPSAASATTKYSYLATGLTANTEYCFVVTSVNPGGESAGSTAASDTTKQTPSQYAVAGAPTINKADLTTDAGSPAVLDAGDVWTLAFNEPVQVNPNLDPTTGTVNFTVTDSDGTVTTVKVPVAKVTINANKVTYNGVDYPAGEVVTVDTTGATITSTGGNSVAQYPTTIQGINGIQDQDESLPVNTAGSADKTIG